MKICTILGTRPEIIKMVPLIREFEKRGVDYFVLHTGQHYDHEMNRIFFEELRLSPEMVNLNIGSGSHGETTGRMLIGIERKLIEKKPDVVLVQGDTNSVLAGALAAVKLHIKLGHVEAGLRSHDRLQPEEYNRIVADHLSDLLFAATEVAEQTLYNEGIPKERVFMTGNTIVDSVYQNLEIAEKNSCLLKKLNLKKDGYFLVTAHREENVDCKKSLAGIFEGLRKVSDEYDMPMVYPLHPRTEKKIADFKMKDAVSGIKNLKLIRPVGFLDMLMLEKNARLILTDSGGVQEESCIFKVPCVVLRDKSDRPESIEIGASILSGCDPDRMLKQTKQILEGTKDWENPFGDGKTGERIIRILEDMHDVTA